MAEHKVGGMTVVTERAASDSNVFRMRVREDPQERVWRVQQFAFKPRKRQPVVVPYWFEEGKTWHVWAGESGEGPPLASFERIGGVREFVARRVGGDG